MLKKRLLYFSAGRVSAFLWRKGTLVSELALENNEEGLATFASYAASNDTSLFYVLADVVEEDFFQESLPQVRGKDRALLLGRKLAQRYRDTTLALTATLGVDTGARREERILFSSFTNTQQFQPWLAALASHEARLVGVYSVPFLSPQLVERAGIKAPRCLVVSLQSGGLRQTLIEDGHMRFSRLGRIENADAASTARTFVTESGRIQQYLTNLRLLPRDSGALDVIILAPAGHQAEFTEACVSNARLRFHVHDLDELASRSGLKSFPPELKSEAIFLHLLATHQPAEQYVAEPMCRFYRLWQARLALLTGGAAVFAFCLLLAGVKLMDVYGLDQLSQLDRDQEQTASQQYARLTQSFPKTPTNTENLKAAVKSYNVMIKQMATPQDLYVDISQALATSPQIEIERINWEISANPTGSVTPRGRAAPAVQPAPPAAGATPAKPAAETRYQVAEISGRVSIPQTNDFRAVSNLVAQFSEALKKQPGWEVTSTKLPFDTDSASALRGGVGEERVSDAPRFTINLSRRIGS